MASGTEITGSCAPEVVQLEAILSSSLGEGEDRAIYKAQPRSLKQMKSCL